jgi:GH25 family lysozyme M1 (1,4-beta-N-acetylmuramidase)
VLTKSKRVLIASALALAGAGGSIAVIRAASSGPENVASAALPVPIGSAATARVPTGPGSADGAGTSGATGAGTTAGNNGQPSSGLTGGTTASGQTRRQPPLPATAGQGDQGPLPAGALAADGAVPGALASLRALAAARAATAALPHSPQLLNELAGPAGWAANSATPTATPTAATTATPTAAATATPTPPAAATATATPSSADATSSPAAADAPAIAAPAAPAASTSAGTPMSGLDVAAYQHPVTSQYPKGTPINWAQVAAAGYRFAAVKGTEGDYYVNPWATTDLADAKAAGLDATPYHFAIPNGSSGQQQAQFAVEYSGYTPGSQTLPLMLDIEYDPYVASDGTNECYGLSASRMTAWISAFVTTARSLTGQYPIIYTTANWWDACTGGSTAFSADPMWVAAYGVDAPPVPAGWQGWSFWQYTSGGTVGGVDSPGTTDLDVFSPTAIGLIDPGSLASRPLTRVSVPLDSLAALVGEKLTWTATGLPPGIRVSSAGVLTGMIANPGSSLSAVSYPVRVTATNTAGASSTVAFSWQVAASCRQNVTLGVCPQG